MGNFYLRYLALNRLGHICFFSDARQYISNFFKKSPIRALHSSSSASCLQVSFNIVTPLYSDDEDLVGGSGGGAEEEGLEAENTVTNILNVKVSTILIWLITWIQLCSFFNWPCEQICYRNWEKLSADINYIKFSIIGLTMYYILWNIYLEWIKLVIKSNEAMRRILPSSFYSAAKSFNCHHEFWHRCPPGCNSKV